MIIVNLFRLLFLLEELFLENKIMEPITCLIFICLLESFLRQGPKTNLYPILAKIHKNNFARGVACEPEALMVAA